MRLWFLSPLAYSSKLAYLHHYPLTLLCDFWLAILKAVNICIDILGPKDINAFQLRYISQKCDVPLGLLAGVGVYLCKGIIL